MEGCNAISDITNIIVALAAVAGAVIAGVALRTWRHELHGRADFELARRIMRAVYQLGNEIRQIRNIFSPEFLDTQYERLNNRASELDLALLEAEILWGNKLQAPKLAIKKSLSTLRLTMRRYFRSEKEQSQLTDKQREEIDVTLYGECDDDDQFGKTVEQAIAEFEHALRPFLKCKE